MTGKIGLRVFDPALGERDHFLLTFDRPGRVEVSVSDDGEVLAHVYEGAEVDLGQQVLFAYDAQNDDNADVTR